TGISLLEKREISPPAIFIEAGLGDRLKHRLHDDALRRPGKPPHPLAIQPQQSAHMLHHRLLGARRPVLVGAHWLAVGADALFAAHGWNIANRRIKIVPAE